TDVRGGVARSTGSGSSRCRPRSTGSRRGARSRRCAGRARCVGLGTRSRGGGGRSFGTGTTRGPGRRRRRRGAGRGGGRSRGGGGTGSGATGRLRCGSRVVGRGRAAGRRGGLRVAGRRPLLDVGRVLAGCVRTLVIAASAAGGTDHGHRYQEDGNRTQGASEHVHRPFSTAM